MKLRQRTPDAGISIAAALEAETLGSAGLWPQELLTEKRSLEQVFLALTQREHLTVTQHDGLPAAATPEAVAS